MALADADHSRCIEQTQGVSLLQYQQAQLRKAGTENEFRGKPVNMSVFGEFGSDPKEGEVVPGKQVSKSSTNDTLMAMQFVNLQSFADCPGSPGIRKKEEIRKITFPTPLSRCKTELVKDDDIPTGGFAIYGFDE